MTTGLTGCLGIGGGGGNSLADNAPLATTGPAADYPMVLGQPFEIDGVTYTPADRLNYDAVGVAALSVDGGTAISGEHRSLPLPSYAEVTALDTGKTILIRLERRGPMSGPALIGLSPGAAVLLGLSGADRPAVRVRRVNPPEAERALLRTGQAAPARMDTPASLLTVLKRKLDQQNGTAVLLAPVAAPTPPPAPVVAASPKPAPKPVPAPSKPATVAAPAPKPAVPKPPAAASAEGALVVQVAVFSTRERADGAAAKLKGTVSQTGKLWRVRMGPFAARPAAEAALAKAKSAGYSDARIQRAG